MERLFECLETKFFKVPDGTFVNPFLNPKDIMSGLPWDMLDGLSIAAGIVEPGVVSAIHVHPFISTVTVLVSGAVELHMKDPGNMEPPYKCTLKLPPRMRQDGFTTVATLAVPGTFLQIDNSRGTEAAHLLYLSTPGYVFEPGMTADAPPVYDDALNLGRDWHRLAKCDWNPPELSEQSRSYAARQNAIQRLAKRSRA